MKKPIKVAIIHNLTGGGAFRIIVETNKILSKHYKIEVFSPPKFKDSNYPIIKIIDYLIYLYWILPEYYKSISKEINMLGFRAAIIHPDSYLKSPTSLFYLKIKTIYLLHEPPREFYEPLHLHAPLLKDKLFTILRIPVVIFDKIATKKASYIVVNSRFSKDKIDKIYGVKSKVIYPGQTETLVKTRKRIKRENLCLSVGSLLPYKGHDLTVMAIGMMSKKPGLVIIGNGRKVEGDKLKALALERNVQLRILENVSDKELTEFYKSARVYVNSAYQEPFGMTSLEALSSGENLVTVKDCGTQELKKHFGEKVVVVDRSPKSISEGISKMIKQKNSVSKVPAIFDWNYFVNGLSKLIDND